MKNIFLSVVVIGALVLAGVGGTLADFSDSEEEMGDTIQAGSLDLKVNGTDDPGVLPFAITNVIPEKLYDVSKTVSNMGTIDGWLYLHIKNVICTEDNIKDIDGDGQITVPGDNPEPENVAQLGGKHGQEQVPGLGERCDMEKHIGIEIWYGPDVANLVPIDLSAYDLNGDGVIKLDEVECNQILIDQLPACGAEFIVNFLFQLQDVPEEYYGLDIFDETDPHEIKWNWWPTNCYQGDTVSFDILFELLQTDYTPPGG
jgi:predicted ribosomally synthesized peptide with SipW-like signal peptide